MPGYEYSPASFHQLVRDAAEEYEAMHPGRRVPGAWRGQIVGNASTAAAQIKEWLARNPISPSDLKQRLMEQFDDAWKVLDEEPNIIAREILLNGGETVIVQSIERNCRFVFWCWGKAKSQTAGSE